MTTIDMTNNQAQNYTHLDYGVSLKTFESIQNDPGRWEQIEIAVRTQTKQSTWTSPEIREFLVKHKDNKNLNLPHFKLKSYSNSPIPFHTETQVHAIGSSKKVTEEPIQQPKNTGQPEEPALKTKEERCAYYRQNPDKYLFYFGEKKSCREFPLMSVLNLVPVFRVVSPATRKALTMVDEKGRETDWERKLPECYKTADGSFEIKGPVLCTYDAAVLAALMYMYVKKKTNGLILSCDFNEIYKTMHTSVKFKAGATHTKAIKRSLIRLQKAEVKKFGDGTNNYLPDFTGPLVFNADEKDGQFEPLPDVKTDQKRSLNIKFSEFFIDHFIHNSFTKVNLDMLTNLKPYELRLCAFLMVRGFSKTGIDYKTATLFQHLYSNQIVMSNRMMVRETTEAINGLIEKGILDTDSKLIRAKSKDNQSHYYLKLVDGLVNTKNT